MHAEVPQSALDQADSFKILPIYIVIDHSWATSEALDTVNNLLMMALIEIPQSCSSEFLRSRGQVSAGSCRS